MLKLSTLSLGLTVALGLCSVGMAGHHDAYPSGQGVYPTAQGVYPSEQGCYEPCGPVEKKRCSLFSGMFKHRPKCYTYEWVLKKKRVRHGLFGGHGGACGDVCETVYPSAQGVYPTAQGIHPAPQGHVAPVYGSGQGAPAYGATQMTAPAYGAGQAAPTYAPGQVAPAPDTSAEPPAIPSDAGESAPPPPAPEGEDQSASAGGLLFLSPAGN